MRGQICLVAVLMAVGFCMLVEWLFLCCVELQWSAQQDIPRIPGA